MHAHCLAQPAGADIGGAGEKQHPEQADTGDLQGQQLCGQWPYRGEITDKGQCRHHADGQPQRVLGRSAQDLVQAPGRCLQLYALVSVTFGDLFAPHKQPGPGALRAGVATPYAPGKYRDCKQAKGGNDQQCRKQDEILRPEGRAEYMKLTFRQVPQHCLTAVPVEPYGAKEQ